MKVLITRPIKESVELIKSLKLSGISAWTFSIFRFLPSLELQHLSKIFKNIKKNDIVCVTSKKTVQFASTYCKINRLTWPVIANYYAIGPGTASLLKIEIGITSKYPSYTYNSESLLQLINLNTIKNKTILVLKGYHGRTILENTFRRYGANVISIKCYHLQIIKKNLHAKIIKWKKRKINTILFTSTIMLKTLYNIFFLFNHEKWILNCHVIVVSNRLKLYAKHLGWKKIHVANSPNNINILKKIIYLKETF